MTQSSLRVQSADDKTNKPEPDILLLDKPLLNVKGDELASGEVRLLIEVGDTTRDYDLGTKAALYARAGIPEYWVISVEERKIYVHTAPTAAGEYMRREAVGAARGGK